jgi:hypothetical protein
VVEYGDILDESQGDIENGMVFRLDPKLNKEVEEKKDTDDPMWASASSAQMDWFFADE